MAGENKTLIKFGYPGSLIKEYKHWYLLLRPQQCTLGSLVLLCKDPVTRFSEISAESFQEYSAVINEVETHLSTLFKYDKINYLMLMMVDPDVHFHIIPRYSTNKIFENVEFIDAGWPALPEFTKCNNINEAIFNKLNETMKNAFCNPDLL